MIDMIKGALRRATGTEAFRGGTCYVRRPPLLLRSVSGHLDSHSDMNLYIDDPLQMVSATA